MFSSYVLYDTVAIEAVYFPHHFTTSRSPASTHVDAARNSTNDPTLPATASTSAPNEECGGGSSSSGSSNDSAPYELTLRDVLLHRLTERYVGRVIPSRGLCVAITDVLEYSASSVRGPAASAWLTATFGVCVFAPAPGTRLKARIAHQSSSGIHLTLDLFVSIPFLVPAAMLVPGSKYSAAQRSWYLPLDSGSGETETAQGGTDTGEGAREGGAGLAQHERADTHHADGLSGGRPGQSNETSTPSAAMSAPSVPHNKYLVGAEVMVKVVACAVMSEEAAAAVASSALDDGESGVSDFVSGGEERPSAIMELQGSFVGDALGPVSWFEDA